MPDETCFLCTAATGADAWYDQPVAVDPEGDAIALPALGALAPGHLLVAPSAHTCAVHHLDRANRCAFARFVLRLLRRVVRAYGTATVFEHSAPSSSASPRSACTDHAHVQIVPRAYPLHEHLPGGAATARLDEFFVEPLPHDGYVMAADVSGRAWVAPDTGVSQYFRRTIAKMEGHADEWDYLLFPRWDYVRETLVVLGD